MKIRNVETKNNIFLAPMAGVTTSSFREICINHNAGLVYAEMVSDKGLIYENNKTLDMIATSKDEHPLAMQVFGGSVDTVTKAAIMIDERCDAEIIDINMGCPVAKVVKNGAGSALLREPEKVYDIVKSVVDNVSKPVTVKIRLGWDHQSINCDKVAKMIEKAGASAVALHARTRSDLYTGNANYDYIKLVKDSVSIPVIGNGDITDIETAEKVFQTGCDAIMIGRAACGNPWIFDQMSTYFETGRIIEKPTKNEIIDTMILHAKKLMIQKNEHTALVEMRTHAAWYLRLLTNTKQYKVKIVSVNTLDELIDIANKVKEDDSIIVKQ